MEDVYNNTQSHTLKPLLKKATLLQLEYLLLFIY